MKWRVVITCYLFLNWRQSVALSKESISVLTGVGAMRITMLLRKLCCLLHCRKLKYMIEISVLDVNAEWSSDYAIFICRSTILHSQEVPLSRAALSDLANDRMLNGSTSLCLDGQIVKTILLYLLKQ